MNKNILLVAVASVLFFGGCKWFDKETASEENKETSTCTSCTQATEEQNSSVLNITNKQEFEEKVLKSEKPIIVKFSADWCETCKEMAPFYAKAADELKDKVSFAAVNATKNAELETLAKEYGVTGFPAILFFKKAEVAKEAEATTVTQGVKELEVKEGEQTPEATEEVKKTEIASTEVKNEVKAKIEGGINEEDLLNKIKEVYPELFPQATE